MKERDWDNLLTLMKTGAVVPVVGPRLLVDEEGTSLSSRVAHKLLKSYEVELGAEPLPPFREMNHVVTLLKGQVKNPQVLYTDIDGALAELSKGKDAVPMPQALRQLAGITDFRLMVTLTSDDLLARALRAEKREVHEVRHSPKLPTEEVTDLQETSITELRPPDKPPFPPVELLYLFGKSRPTPMCAIHDEDMLEYAHNIILKGSHVPEKFMGMLRECNLLLIGCNFPDWLSRFILRATRKGGLAAATDRREWLVEKLASEDPFVGFLGQYSPATEVLSSIEPTQFVQELRRRWDAREAEAAQQREQFPSTVMPVTVMPGGASTQKAPSGARTFFISYSRGDKDSALALRNALLKLGAREDDIWFDEEVIQVGSNYERLILEGIRGSRYVLPLVSLACTQREEGFVFREWGEATDQAKSKNRTYLVPLVIDEDYDLQVYRQESVLTWQDKHVDIGHAPGGKPDGKTLSNLKQLLREVRG